MLPEKLSFVDIETTGGSLAKSRIIEVAVIRVDNGTVTEVFSSLVNPQEYIPQEILDFTGIDLLEVEKAPTFYDLKDEIHEILKDSIFVAHNVRFDYAFIKKELRENEINFNSKQLCTVKLSRKLFPSHRYHNLDAIIDRFGIKVGHRHRALDDAKAIFEFFQKVKDSFDETQIIQAINVNLQRPSVPLNIDPKELEVLPETPGVYIFYADNKMPLYIGKSVNLRRRVLSHFSGDLILGTDLKIAQQVNSIKTIDTAGNLGAMLKESQLIKRLQPIYNKKLRTSQNLVLLNLVKNDLGYEEAVITEANELSYDKLINAYGVFRGREKARKFLQTVLKENELCDKLLGLEHTKGSCFSHKLEICKGACLGLENPMKYNLRLYTALAGHKVKSWPFKGAVQITEFNEENGITDTFTIQNWKILNYRSGNEVHDELPFDLDTYKILLSHFNEPRNHKNIRQVA